MSDSVTISSTGNLYIDTTGKEVYDQWTQESHNYCYPYVTTYYPWYVAYPTGIDKKKVIKALKKLREKGELTEKGYVRLLETLLDEDE